MIGYASGLIPSTPIQLGGYFRCASGIILSTTFSITTLQTSGWLVCDDGAMEVADFIHLDGDLLTLIHAKGAQSADPARNVSVSSYEVVASQATKCLRWLDEVFLSQNLAAGIGRKVGHAVWHDREPSTREDFLREIQDLGTRYRRRVVILQPQITDRNFAHGATANGPEGIRHRQLMTLLNGTRAACQAVGAELVVVGQRVAAGNAPRTQRAKR